MAAEPSKPAHRLLIFRFAAVLPLWNTANAATFLPWETKQGETPQSRACFGEGELRRWPHKKRQSKDQGKPLAADVARSHLNWRVTPPWAPRWGSASACFWR